MSSAIRRMIRGIKRSRRPTTVNRAMPGRVVVDIALCPNCLSHGKVALLLDHETGMPVFDVTCEYDDDNGSPGLAT